MHEHMNKYAKMQKKKKKEKKKEKKPTQGTTKHAQQAQKKKTKHDITQSGQLIMLQGTYKANKRSTNMQS